MLAVPSLDAHAHARRLARVARLADVLRERILVLDGAMGTMLQGYGSAKPTSAVRASRNIRVTCAAPTTCSR